MAKGVEIRVVCWRDAKGGKPVREWIEALDTQSTKQIHKLLQMLRKEQQNLGMPYVRHLGDGLFELRDPRQGGPGYRLYYCWSGTTIVVLLVGGDKSSQENDIVTARERMQGGE